MQPWFGTAYTRFEADIFSYGSVFHSDPNTFFLCLKDFNVLQR